VRFNRNGYDINRNWEAQIRKNPESRKLMAEICAAEENILRLLGLFLTLHNQERGRVAEQLEKNRAIATLLRGDARPDHLQSAGKARAPSPKPAPGGPRCYEYLDGRRGLSAFLLGRGSQARSSGAADVAGPREFGSR